MKKSQKTLQQINIVFFIAFLTIPTLIFPFVSQFTQNKNNENRIIATKPSFNFKEIYNYPKEYETYFQDNLAFKNQFVMLNNIINLRLFNSLSSEKVLLGKDNWLFYKSINDGDPIGCYQGVNLFSSEELTAYTDNLITLRDTLKTHGKEFVLFIAPNKEQVYDDYMPNKIKVISDFSRADQLVKHLKENTDLDIVYPKDELIQNKSKYQVYSKNDTHWNEFGAYIGSQQLLKLLIDKRLYLHDLEYTLGDDEIGDLAKMVNIQDIFKKDKKIIINNYYNNIKVKDISEENSDLQTYQSNSTYLKSPLLIGDSFRTRMIPYLSKNFEKSYFASGTITPEEIKNINADIIILEVVERYIPAIPQYCDKLISSTL